MKAIYIFIVNNFIKGKIKNLYKHDVEGISILAIVINIFGYLYFSL